MFLRSEYHLCRRQFFAPPNPRRRKQSHPAVRRSPLPTKKFVMGQVRILKRGEHEDEDLELIVSMFAGLQDPDAVRRQVYAGAAFLSSPPPSSLPFPSALVRSTWRLAIFGGC